MSFPSEKGKKGVKKQIFAIIIVVIIPIEYFPIFEKCEKKKSGSIKSIVMN